MSEKRKQQRKKVSHSLAVHDLSRDIVLGHVVDISAAGFLLLGSGNMPVGGIFRLGLELPAEINCGARAEFGAESLWVEPSLEPNRRWIGFRIIDISPENAAKLQRLIDAVDDGAD
jgi:hypothetical protein